MRTTQAYGRDVELSGECIVHWVWDLGIKRCSWCGRALFGGDWKQARAVLFWGFVGLVKWSWTCSCGGYYGTDTSSGSGGGTVARSFVGGLTEDPTCAVDGPGWSCSSFDLRHMQTVWFGVMCWGLHRNLMQVLRVGWS